MKNILRIFAAIAATLPGTSLVHAGSLAPRSTVGLDIVLTIQKTESSLPGGFPTMGAVRQTYAADGTYTYSGFGGPNHLTGPGTYVYARTGNRTATEDAVQSSDFFTLPYHMEYTFVTSDAGLWKQEFAGGVIVFEGSFATSPVDARHRWAPATLEGALLILAEWDGHWRGRLETLRHHEGHYTLQSIGRREHEKGTYVARRMSARSLVEETTRSDGSLVVRSFTFTHANGGYWKATKAADGRRSEGTFLLFQGRPMQ